MANVRISPVFNDAQFVANGELLAGGKIYTFDALSNTQDATYTDSSGKITNSNPIVLDSSGRLQSEIWLTANEPYKLVLTDRANVVIQTYDNVLGLPTPPANTFYKSVVFTDDVFYDNNGEILANGKIYSYLNNSFTSKIPTYSDNTGNTPNPNPITLSSSGTLDTGLYLDTNKKYNLVLTKSDGTTILKNYNGSYGELDANVPSPTIDSFTFNPTPVVVGGFPFTIEWQTSNAIAVTYEITANITGNNSVIQSGFGPIDGNVGNTALNAYWSMSANLTAEGAPGASPLYDYATANVLVSTVYTTALYPYYFAEELNVNLPTVESGFTFGAIQEGVDLPLPNISAGNLITVVNLVDYNDYPIEELDIALPTIIAGNLEQSVNSINYNDYPMEEIDIPLPIITTGNLITVVNLIDYNDYPAEELDIALPTIVSGTLS